MHGAAVGLRCSSEHARSRRIDASYEGCQTAAGGVIESLKMMHYFIGIVQKFLQNKLTAANVAGYSFGASTTELRGGRERNGRRQARLSYGIALCDSRRRPGGYQSAAKAGCPTGSRAGLSETDGPGLGHTQGRPVNRRDAAPSRWIAISYTICPAISYFWHTAESHGIRRTSRAEYPRKDVSIAIISLI